MNHIFLIKKHLMIKDLNDSQIPYHEQYLTYELIQGDVTIQVRTNANTITYYKIDDNDWQKLNITTDPDGGTLLIGTIDLVEGQKIQFAANALDLTWKINFEYPSNQNTLYNIYGNYMSIIYADTSVLSNLNYTNFSTKTEWLQILTDVNGYPIYNIKVITPAVYNAENLILPATNLFYNCYAEMFADCSSLITAPKLPATTLAERCYAGMFCGCTSLTTAPKLPATTLAKRCYAGMFCGCTSLTTAPKLPATSLFPYCYSSMFNGCKKLAAAPELPADYLVSGCYSDMFYNCSMLNYIKIHAINISASDCLRGWVYGVSSEGTFFKKSGVDIPWAADSNYSGIPDGWDVVEI